MSNSTDTYPESNPYFNRIERAPYELGQLLLQLPDYFSAFAPMEPDVLLKASAAADHARNANDTLMHGLEALAVLGCLIQHIAVEAQFLQETERSTKFAVQRQNGGMD